MTSMSAGKSSSSRNSDLLMMSLSSFYAQKGSIQRIMPIVNGLSPCSLRLIDWFVTNYAKKRNTIITHQQSDNNITHFNVYLSYRSQLKAYSKQQFDPFRRRERILFYYDKDKAIETTIGQLNFFRWVLQNGMLEYISQHLAEIEDDMVAQSKPPVPADAPLVGDVGCTVGTSNKYHHSNGSKGKVPVTQPKKKRAEITKSTATRNMNHIAGTRSVRFD